MDFFSFLPVFILATLVSIKSIVSFNWRNFKLRKTLWKLHFIFLFINLFLFTIKVKSVFGLSPKELVYCLLESIKFLLFSDYHLRITGFLMLFQLDFYFLFGVRYAIIPEKYLIFIHVFYLALSISKLEWYGVLSISLTIIFCQCHVYFRFYENSIRIKAGIFGLFAVSLNYYLESLTFREILGQLFDNILSPLFYIVIFFCFNGFCFAISKSVKNDFVRLNPLNKIKGSRIFLHVFLYSEHRKNSSYYKIMGLFVLNTLLLIASEYYLEGYHSFLTNLSFLGFSHLFGLICIIDYKPVSSFEFSINFLSVFASLNFYYKIFRN